ncbi:transposase [Flavobacterium sp.]|uniref:helix-turn-helix domain-containing protein n=1 Tax=Flavobacterium sp. TaxID=239 RepID=UPI00374CD6FA
MSAPKTFKIKQSESELKKIMKNSPLMIAKRIHALLVFKKNEANGISKRLVAEEIGVNHNSVQTWRKLYIAGGIKLLMSHSNIGYKPSKITHEQELALKEQLNNPQNGMAGFIELLDWFNKNFKTDLNYKTFHGFVVRKYKAKIKVARKSHIKKDVQAVETFKKTSSSSAKILSLKKPKATKK